MKSQLLQSCRKKAPSWPSPRGRNTLSMVSRMNGHLSCLDEYALIIAALYFSASCLSAPAHCVPLHRWVIEKRMGAILFGAHSFPTMIVGSVTSLSFDLVVHSHPAMSRRGLPLRQSLDEGCQESTISASWVGVLPIPLH